MGNVEDGNGWHTLFWLLVGFLGNMVEVAAIIGGCFIAAAPIVAYQKYKALRKERDDLQWHVERLSRENNALMEKARNANS